MTRLEVVWGVLTAPFPATMLAIIATAIVAVAYIERGPRP